MIENVLEIVKHVGGVHLSYFGGEYEIGYKRDETDVVTQVDKECEAYLRVELEKLLPGSQVLGEEENDCIDDYSGYVWIVDPLDGTKNFSENNEKFGCLLGLCKDGEPVLGVAFFPKLDKLYFAQLGCGAFLETNGERKQIFVDKTLTFENSKPESSFSIHESFEKSFLCSMQTMSFTNRATQESLCVKGTQGSTGLSLCQIADGTHGGVLKIKTRNGKRDVCGPQLIITEAEGVMTDISGNPIDYTARSNTMSNGILAGNSVMHSKILHFISGG